jgi:hypothetical protein
MKEKTKEIIRVYPNFKQGIIAGMGWAFGVTVGFVLISTIIVFALNLLGGLPLIGNWIANIIAETQEQLQQRTPVYR